jgi:hypothetical protein
MSATVDCAEANTRDMRATAGVLRDTLRELRAATARIAELEAENAGLRKGTVAA